MKQLQLMEERKSVQSTEETEQLQSMGDRKQMQLHGDTAIISRQVLFSNVLVVVLLI